MEQTGPFKLYQEKIASGELKQDPAQEKIIHLLQRLHDDLLTYDPEARKRRTLGNLFGLKKSRENIPKGLYLYGGVGRGKSMMMDLFYQTAPVSKKRRVHFHAFMIELHSFIHAYRSSQKSNEAVDIALNEFARVIAEDSWLLCFDEFHVTDVADAMLLGRLFTAMWQEGVIVFATSNWAPDDLYKGGLQRDRFLPFIVALKEKLAVAPIDNGQDYRLARLRGMPVYYWPLDADTERRMEHGWRDLAQNHSEESMRLTVQGRSLRISRFIGRLVWLEFEEWCGGDHGAADYLAIAQAFDVVFLSRVRPIAVEERNKAKRLMTLIDILYENKVKLVISADSPPDQIYPKGKHAFEFERSVSRLMEMQSVTYLASTK